MTHDEYKKLCDRFEVEVELERMALTKKLQDKRGPILYLGSPRVRKELRAEWEASQQKELAEELEYQTKRSELEYFGVDGKEGAKAMIKEDKPDKWYIRGQKFIKGKFQKLTQFITKPIQHLTGIIYAGR